MSVFGRLAEETDSTPSNPALHEDRLRQLEEPGSKLLRFLWSGHQGSQETGKFHAAVSPRACRPTNLKTFVVFGLFGRFQQLSVRCPKPTKTLWRSTGRRLHCAGSTTSSWWSSKVWSEEEMINV